MALRYLEMVSVMLAVAAFALISPASPTSSRLIVPRSYNETAYEVLESFGFPRGLLPSNVESYTLDDDDGSFSVFLESSCKFSISGYKVRYSSTITGSISTGSISDLSGASVRVLWFWLTINSITVSGTDLVFKVGGVSRTFASSNFNDIPECMGVPGPYLD